MLGLDTLAFLLRRRALEPLTHLDTLPIGHELLTIERCWQLGTALTRPGHHSRLVLGSEPYPLSICRQGLQLVAVLFPLLCRHQIVTVDIAVAYVIAIPSVELIPVAILIAVPIPITIAVE
jgi:hypothetical protein